MSVLHTVRYAAKRAGQVTVELLLVLPVFMMMIGFIMELGNLAHQTILAHHCTYELARIGSLVAGPRGGSPSSACEAGLAASKMETVLAEMFPNPPEKIKLDPPPVCTDPVVDPQTAGSRYPHTNQDLVVTLVYPAKLFFPFSSYILADQPRDLRIRHITVVVRMPVEKPVF